MDWVAVGKRASTAFGKYKYAVLIIALGMLLMMLPSEPAAQEPQLVSVQPESQENIQDQLAVILSQIDGVGKVRVMITEESGSQTVYQTDQNRTESEGNKSARVETVIISGENGEAGLIQTITPPIYLGAIVVCQGADSPVVRLQIAQAVSAVTGISTDRISVLKMK